MLVGSFAAGSSFSPFRKLCVGVGLAIIGSVALGVKSMREMEQREAVNQDLGKVLNEIRSDSLKEMQSDSMTRSATARLRRSQQAFEDAARNSDGDDAKVKRASARLIQEWADAYEPLEKLTNEPRPENYFDYSVLKDRAQLEQRRAFIRQCVTLSAELEKFSEKVRDRMSELLQEEGVVGPALEKALLDHDRESAYFLHVQVRVDRSAARLYASLNGILELLNAELGRWTEVDEMLDFESDKADEACAVLMKDLQEVIAESATAEKAMITWTKQNSNG